MPNRLGRRRATTAPNPVEIPAPIIDPVIEDDYMDDIDSCDSSLSINLPPYEYTPPVTAAVSSVPNIKYYTGIGARECPPEVITQVSALGAELALKGYVLRSGHTSGVDKAFENGCTVTKGAKEIYLPKARYGHAPDNDMLYYNIQNHPKRSSAMQMAQKLHKNWDLVRESRFEWFQTRSIYEILGYDLNAPSSFMLCWTKDGEETGAIKTAIECARTNWVPVINIFYDNWREVLDMYMEELEYALSSA